MPAVSSSALQTTHRPAPAARSTRRDDQARETKLRLIAAAVSLVTEVGWRRTTIEQISERAGVAKGTFFVHFKAKEAIVVSLVQYQINAASAAREAVITEGGSPVDCLRAATLTLGTQAASNIELSRAVLIASLESREVGSATDLAFNALYTRMIEDAGEAIARGLIEGPDAETIASLLMACYLGAALHCTSSPSAKPLSDVLRPLVEATIGAFTKTPTVKNGSGSRRRRGGAK